MQTFDTPNDTEGAAPTATQERPGGTNGTQDSTDSQNNHALAQPADGADADGGSETGEVGEGAELQEGEVEGAESSPESGDVAEPAAFDPSAFEQNLLQKIEEKFANQNQPAAPPQLSEEQWQQKEEEFGMNRRAIQRNISMLTQVHDKIMSHIEERFARLEKEPAINNLARKPGFTDAPRFKAGMDEYLSRFSPALHNNPELLEQAYYYAKGKASGQTIQRVRKATEVNRRVAGPSRPASPSAGARRPAPAGLSAIEKDTAQRFGMSEAEYAKFKVGGKSVRFS